MATTPPRRVLILGAAGRDFHNFNTLFRDDPAHRVLGFTAAQIPDIAGRRYPPVLAGPLYPEGIPISEESELPELIAALGVDECVFAYSDVSYDHVMHLSAIANTAGADFRLVAPTRTMIESRKPVIAVVATRTGTGKSQTCRAIVARLSARGLRVVTVRHPMPYGDLAAQGLQRFAQLADLDTHGCTIEEREEYEPHIEAGNVIYAGVDYAAILNAAENDSDGCDLILWDGGNNDTSFFRPDLTITVTDPQRGTDALNHYAGEINLRMADVVLINKVDSASPEALQRTEATIAATNPAATVVRAESRISVDAPELIAGKRVLVVEDGPSLTHGNLPFGAGFLAAQRFGAAQIVDPRRWAVGRLARTFEQWPQLGPVLPAMGYGHTQLEELEATIRACEVDTVIIGTPIDLGRVLTIDKPATRVHYALAEIGQPNLDMVLDVFLAQIAQSG